MDAGGAAEPESGSPSSAAFVGEEVDFRLPLDWKNLLRTACLAGAGPAAAAPPPGGFRRDIAVQRLTARPSRAREPARGLVPGCLRDRARRVLTLRRGGGRGGGVVSRAPMGPRGRVGTISRQA